MVTPTKMQCNARERKKMSRLAANRGDQFFKTRRAGARKALGMLIKIERTKNKPHKMPVHSAQTLAIAAPLTPHLSPKTNHKARTILTLLVTTIMASGARAFWRPNSHPTKAYWVSVAGKPKRRIWKKELAMARNSSDGFITNKPNCKNGSDKTANSSARPKAISKLCNKIRCKRVSLRWPAACAAKPVVVMRKNMVSEAITL